MKRREFLLTVGAAVVAPAFTVRAEEKGRVYRIGFLRNGPPPQSFIEPLREGLRQLGYIEGQNIRIEYGLADSAERLPETAAELVRRQVDVIIASGTPPVPAAKNATKTIPIVFVASIDAIATGTVASLARPGGNITGFTAISAELMGKRLELLREIVPGLARVAVLGQEKNPGNREYLRQAEAGAGTLGLQVQIVTVRDAGDFARAFAEMRGIGAVIQLEDVLFTSHRKRMTELAAENRLPVMYGIREFIDAGGLLAYGPDLQHQYREAATYVDKILKGAKPADLPVQQPTKIEFLVNLKAAKAIGLTIPQPILLRADQILE